MLTLQLDVDELESKTLDSALFGYNCWRICSVWARDYLTGTESLRSRVESIVQRHGVREAPARITLVTMPRYFGYVFNPVSFFICFDSSDSVVACITQVHNTFGECHIYPLVCDPSSIPVSWRFDKKFFVSPFFDSQGEYALTLRGEGHHLTIQVDLHKGPKQVFSATLDGSAVRLSKTNLFKALARYPFALLLTMPRIHMQALALFFRARAQPFLKPKPSDPYTIRSNQNSIHRARLTLLSLLRRVRGV
jgi:cyclopropane-fatty-acyl-phospholipid synthase